MDNELWIKTLEEWRNKKMGSNGCTLPFLVGIMTITNPPKTPTSADLEQILSYIFENNTIGEKYVLSMCETLKKAIIQKVNNENTYEPDDENATWYGKNLLINNTIIMRYGSVQAEIIKGLVSEFEPIILENNYSLNGDVWGNYSDKEIAFLKVIISN